MAGSDSVGQAPHNSADSMRQTARFRTWCIYSSIPLMLVAAGMMIAAAVVADRAGKEMAAYYLVPAVYAANMVSVYVSLLVMSRSGRILARSRSIWLGLPLTAFSGWIFGAVFLLIAFKN